MKAQSTTILSFIFVLLFSFQSWITLADDSHERFLHCLSQYSENSTSISKVIYTQNNSSYSSVLELTIQNQRFSTPTTPKPVVIITPLQISHIQATIKCSQKYGLQIRTRSGGHDYEGLSYVADVPFVTIDMRNFSSIDIDAENKTAWVQVGATLGELYYSIAEKSRTLAFPAGVCATVGIGGHISGGGHGILLRKYGLAADNAVDAHLIDVHGRFLDRKSMGEDLFWAIRGGGGASFGVIVAWKVKLVDVPSTVTVFTVQKTLEQNLTKVYNKWQRIADKLPEDLYIMVFLRSLNTEEKRTMQATFQSLFLGGVDKLLPLMQERFPELGVGKDDCHEITWAQSVLYIGGYQIEEISDLYPLINRTAIFREPFKGKSDYVREPLPELALEGIYERFFKEEANATQLVIVPYGGKMSEISESEIPFPHRAGNIYAIEHVVYWDEDASTEEAQRHINWIRDLYKFLTPYVSKNPRAAYINYRDLDIGTNNKGYTSYEQASIWGKKYFKKNFDRLVRVKTKVDPGNFFRNEQSIPPLPAWRKNKDD
ncbi:Tetrahydrocannabinolic acid synthase [Melia azedarach]|uniref:Tetrahydrocannabinolic acid synthase n=1 Tax=Melia azedarach TaxID=155640 RepID=A0ACC1WV66_MELAZ|nr:Tetrahydrocannabinolic acid synthase [Melia azedarach]